MTWITILFIGEKDNPEKFAEVVEFLNYCVFYDKFRNFRYEVQPGGEGIKIYSPSKDVAYKRGSMFKKRFDINYQVI